MWKRLLATFVAVTLPFATPASAASLRVSPILIDLTGKAATSNVRLWNDGDKPVNVQVRIFRWRQQDGKDVYLPADGVVVSPPMAVLKPGAENYVRVVRTAKGRPAAEDAYRLIVDELPSPGARRSGTVALVVRQSIPVFFSPETAGESDVRWSAKAVKGGYELSGTNTGGRRLKIFDLALKNGDRTVAAQKGLVGYVLGHSSARWFIPATAKGQAGTLRLTTATEAGPLDAAVALTRG